MPQSVVESDQRTFALQALLERLESGPLEVATDSCVAAALGVEVSNRIMASAQHTAIRSGWVVRIRDRDASDHYDNPVTLKITRGGRARLTQLNTL